MKRCQKMLRIGTRNNEQRKTTELVLEATKRAFYKNLSYNVLTKVVADVHECRQTGEFSGIIREARNGEKGYSFSPSKTSVKSYQARIPLSRNLPSFRLGTLEVHQRGRCLVVRIPPIQNPKTSRPHNQGEFSFDVTEVIG